MTDPTITIAGLTAERDALILSLRASIDYGATSEEVRLIAAAELASAKAERDALAAQLAEVRARLDAAPRSIELAELQAAHEKVLASERAHLAACQTRIAGLESAANERSAEVARLTARVAELEARPVLTVERLTSAVYLSRGIPMDIAAEAAKAILAALGPVTLPAHDAAERMAAAYCDAQREIGGKEWLGWSRVASGSSEVRDLIVESMRRALASLGAPPTSPTTTPTTKPTVAPSVAPSVANVVQSMRDAVDAERSARMDAMGGRSISSAHLYDSGAIWACQWVAAAKAVIALIGSSPTAARPVFAGVSEENLANTAATAHRECRDHNPWMAVARAVLARLEVSLVAPVDPEAVAKAYHDCEDGPPDVPTWIATSSHGRATSAMRATLTAAGIPVTPEPGK